MTYVMHEKMYYNLCNVTGFTNINGRTYQEHLTIILKVEDEIKNLVLNSETAEDAKNILKENGIVFTHTYNN